MHLVEALRLGHRELDEPRGAYDEAVGFEVGEDLSGKPVLDRVGFDDREREHGR